MARGLLIMLLALAAAVPAADASFPGANGALAYTVNGGRSLDVKVVGGSRTLARGAGAPAFSADGRRLAWSAARMLYVDGRRLNLGREASEPAWSPDGSRLAFTSGADVWTVRADGRRARRVGAGWKAAWSPDGRRLALIRDFALVTVRADGSGATTVAQGALAADWSPDGRRLAFARRATTGDQGAELWTAAAAGGDERQVTSGANDVAPRFSPDGRRVAFVRDGDVWSVDVAGAALRRLTTSGDATGALAWRPRR